MNEPLLRVIDQRTAFVTSRGLLQAVDGVTFDLEEGKTLGIVGESGSGKSVLSRSIMRLLAPNAHVGPESKVLLNGRNLYEMSEKALRSIRGREIGIVLQDPMTSLNPVLTNGSQVAEVLTHHLGIRKRVAMDQAVDLFAAVGLPQPEIRVHQYPHQLSGGMRQRVAIAIAIACEPSLLIADEPTTALDVTVQAEILDLLERQQRKRNMAMILITHDMGIVARRTHDVAVMYAGQFVEYGPTRDILINTRMPYTTALLSSIPRLSDAPDHRLTAIPGRPPDLINKPPGCTFAPRCPHADQPCLAEPPPLSGQSRHRFACWHPDSSGSDR